MFRRQKTGSVVCVSCGYLVGVRDETCYHCGRRNPGLWGFAPALRSLGHDLGFVPFVTGLSILAYGVSLLLSGDRIGMNGWNLLSPDHCVLLQVGGSGPYALVTGRWWSLLSASWLHGSLLHILFNMYWVRQLGPSVAELYGPGRMVIIYVAAGVAGFLVSSVAGIYLPFVRAGVTVGASASILGLLGALVYYGRRGGSSAVGSTAMYYAAVMFLMGLVMSGTDNFAHAGGFAGGWLAGRLLDPLRQERINHMLAAVILLALSALSLIVSGLVPLSPMLGCG